MAQVKPDIANLIEWWEMNEASGDALGSHAGLTMADNNTVGSAAGVVAGGRDFERDTTEYFSRASEAALQMGDIDATWIFWYKPESVVGGGNWIIVKDDLTDREYGFFHRSADGKVQINIFDGTNSIGVKIHSTVLSLGSWFMIAGYHSSTLNEVGISINAGAYQTVATSGAAGTTTRPLWIGENETSAVSLDGVMDETSYWKNVILSVDNLEWYYNGGNGRSYSDLVGRQKIFFIT